VPADLGDLTGTHHECAREMGHPPPNHPMVSFRDNPPDHALQQLGGEECKGDW
jgi:hypothetical protein